MPEDNDITHTVTHHFNCSLTNHTCCCNAFIMLIIIIHAEYVVVDLDWKLTNTKKMLGGNRHGCCNTNRPVPSS